ncbi:elongation factor P maturation arginine rhamnosyltransferase EarP [Pseudoduganella buxea]|uniref:Protein-arginine rhamnosyltransferase n=1 Tax=Pseudoduganella buxea TaxID=1949069 RepID=A0A6I3T4F8_9BURK|nr:elongation factor P maturation arginine rhamnosyltransferase EarP [Pseudoduganella buxea]MTV56411.1 elongation factor P maturation arginine rhamnosyltransferase EarP [Pseudoduganella buxea]GGB82134.1 hypothetical protein GCM10011572_00020 [Pseudoduganella buxea]
MPTQHASPSPATTLAIFCKVVDNFGDIGICWRLSRQLASERGITVTLWVDDLGSFKRICPRLDSEAATQTVEGVTVRHWTDQDGQFAPEDVADIVIEFFAVDIPPGYVEAMARREPRPVWLNLEGLTAEDWVEGCHTLPSMHPRLPLTKHFYFPGFNARTGGLPREGGLLAERDAFQADPVNAARFLAGLGVTPGEMAATKVSLFCYPHAPVSALLDAWRDGGSAVTCLVPEGVAREAVQAFLGGDAHAGAARTQGALTVRVLPFVPQSDYDRLLWACDVNFVRGEDSFVRAQWAGKPFVWHIYPQDENLHHKKLRAFLDVYAPDLPSLVALSLRWNGASPAGGEDAADLAHLWQAMHADVERLVEHAAAWEARMLEIGDLANNLLEFARSPR